MSRRPYPAAPRRDLVEELHGRRVADPYRALEDADAAETRDWLAAQDELFQQTAAGWPARERFRARVTELLGTGSVGAPVWRGTRRFFTRRAADQELAVLYTADATGTERVLIDPMLLDPGGTTTLDAWAPDVEGRRLAYELSEGGDEESRLFVLDVETGALIEGPIDRCRYGSIGWLPGGDAYYYVRRLPADQVPAGEDQYHRRVYLHRVGTDPDTDDVLIFGAEREKTNYYGVSVSRDGRWLTVSAARGTAPRNDLWLADLTAAPLQRPRLRAVQEGVDAHTSLHVGRDGRAYLFTDRDAPRGRLCVADPADPGYENWRDLLPEDPEAVLSDYALLDGGPDGGPDGGAGYRPVLLAGRTRHAIGELTAHDLGTGELIGGVDLPGLGTLGGIVERPEGGHEAWFGYTDNVTPGCVLHYDARSGITRLWAAAPGAAGFEPPRVTTRQIRYESQDGTEVRMLVIAPPDGTGPRPTILYGYGGFNISLTPAYSASVLAWVESGGVYAIAGLRGGSEEGEEWHRAGMLDRKQNVFDDFHAAAERLIADGWTAPDRLAISGGSNGGLLVGAALTQRPDLYRAAVCSAPLLDMVRYERFGLGRTWNVEYGSADVPEELDVLLAYSPYHRVRAGVGYPATLFTVFDNDSRVHPLHAWKMCAALQHATSRDVRTAPILLRREPDVGHGNRSVSRTAGLAADTLAFITAMVNGDH